MGSHGGKIPSTISLLQNLKILTTPKVWSIKAQIYRTVSDCSP